MDKGMAKVKTSAGELSVYKAVPSGPIKGGVIVIHEVWGLEDHIKDVADRFAAAGYYAVAPDLLAGTEVGKLISPDLFKMFSDPEKRQLMQVEFRKIMGPLNSPEFYNQTTEKLHALFKWLSAQPETKGKVASVGFCFGGTYTYSLATVEPDLVAAVPFYGHANHDIDKLKSIKSPILAFYGEKDENLMNQLPELIDRMEQAGVKFTHKVYPGTGHAFFNDRNPLLYNESAADDAWKLTMQFLDDEFKAEKNSHTLET